MKGKQECWMTYARSFDEAVSALVLAKSLRRCLTTKTLGIILSPDLPHNLRYILEQAFDQTFQLKENGWHPEIHLWRFFQWQKIAFVSPFALVVKNCDEIFESKDVLVQGPSNDIFLAKPSRKLWQRIRWFLQSQNYDKLKLVQEVLRFIALEETEGKLNENLVAIITEKPGFETTNTNFSLAVFKEAPCYFLQKDTEESSNFVLRRLLELWKEAFCQGAAKFLHSSSVKVENPNLLELLGKYKEAPEKFQPESSLESLRNSVAVVGVSFRLPGANNFGEFWDLLLNGGNTIIPVPEDRWSLDRVHEVSANDKKSRAGFLKLNLLEFDGKFFGVSPSELEFMDPQQRLTLQVAWEALEDAGINPLELQNTFTGVFGGLWRTDYKDILQGSGVLQSEFYRSYMGNTMGVLTARISHVLGLTGPSVATESGCSASMVAVDLACKSLQSGETNLSLACGVNLLLHPFSYEKMQMVLSPDFQCKTFDADANGFVRAEACAVLVMKRFADAVRDGDRVYGLIRGSAVVQEGASKSLGTPTKYCEALAMSRALDDAEVAPEEVDYLETHGTGTSVGDPLEVAAISQVYKGNRTLQIGSVKTNIGHTESMSGIAGILKVLISMKNNMIPPHTNFKTLNPEINLTEIPAEIPLSPIPWNKENKIAGVSSFGITGTDTHVILQEPPASNLLPEHPFQQDILQDVSKRPQHVFVISAKNEESLKGNCEKWREFLMKEENISLIDALHTANVGRAHFSNRLAVTISDKASLISALGNDNYVFHAPELPPKLCFLFTGQGSQYTGMGKALYAHSMTFRLNLDKCHDFLHKTYGMDLKSAMWDENSTDLSRSLYSQTSIFVIEYCMLELWKSWGVTPSCVVGHSLGEFAAAVAAGVLEFEDALKLVAERSRLIDALPRGKMLVIKENGERVKSLIKTAFEGTSKWLDFAALNSPEQTVVAGDEENVKLFAEFCKNNKLKCTILNSSHAFHSRHMDPMLNEYKQFASTLHYKKPSVEYISGMEGNEMSEINSDYWVKHTRDMVRFENAIKSVLRNGCSHFLELGPQPVLSALAMINSSDMQELESTPVCLPSIRKNEEDWTTIFNTVTRLYGAGVVLNWRNISPGKPVTAPFYSFQTKEHWFQMPDLGPSEFHPLTGKQIPNASTSKIFSQKLDVNILDYLNDHCIGSKVIFPGAGFLEMCLVSGHAATSCTELSYFHPTAPVTVENFVIESPLGLSSAEKTEVQVVVTMEESGETKVTIYSKLVLDKETQKWIKHASATFNPYISNMSNPNQIVLNEVKERCSSPLNIEETYKKLSEFGMKFGPTFQTLQTISKSNEGDVLFEAKVTTDCDNYVSHPVITDALIQALMSATSSETQSLHVPVSVKKFTVFTGLKSTPGSNCYVLCRKLEGSEEYSAMLYDSEGTLVAQMDGAVLVETTVSSIMAALESQKLSLPTMFEDTWKMSSEGAFDRRIDALEAFDQNIFDENIRKQVCEEYETTNDDEKAFLLVAEKLYSCYMIKSFYDLEIIPKLNSVYVIADVAKSAKILPSLEKFLQYEFLELTKDGYFELCNNAQPNSASFKCIREFPTIDVIEKSIEEFFHASHKMSPNEIDYVSGTGKYLADFLRGKRDALAVLFPEDSSLVSAEAYYMEAVLSRKAHELTRSFFTQLLNETSNLLEERKKTVKILEVGSGTGSITKTLLPLLEPGKNFEYTYSDISPIFFETGKKIFENSSIKALYKVLDIEKDPIAQGYLPQHYDMIVANNVIHATKDITNTTKNLRNLLRDNGILVVSESIQPYRPTVLTFGLLGAYWHWTDDHLRGFNTEISAEKWQKVLNQSGFDRTVAYPCFDNVFGLIAGRAKPGHPYVSVVEPQKTNVWVIFGLPGNEITDYMQINLRQFGFKTVLITPGEKFCKISDNGTLKFEVNGMEESGIANIYTYLKSNGWDVEGTLFLWGLQPTDNKNETLAVTTYFHICKTTVTMEKPKLFCVTRGVQSVGDQTVSLPHTAPMISLTKCFQNEQPNGVARSIDLGDNEKFTKEHLAEILNELVLDDGEIYVAYRDHHRYVPRFVPWKPPTSVLSFPKSERFHLCIPPTNAISDLRFGPVTVTEALPPTHVEVKVKSYALNFRDVFVVLKPSAEFENFNTVGIDWSGEVVSVGAEVKKYKVGDAVLGMNLRGDSLPSHITIEESLALSVPKYMSFNEAATLPAVGATAFVCLMQVAKLKKEDTVLIHTGSGGVGIVAIQIAKSIGARIVATAGSKRKRAFIKSLGVEHVFHSRNTSYEEGIRKSVGTVDVVVNSLTSEGFKEASMAVLAQGGKFIEMSKLNIWSEEDVKKTRPDVYYKIVDLSSSSDDELKSLVMSLNEMLQKKIVQPVPFCRFDASEIREALTYMQKAKHIGKIVVTMPESDGKINMFNDRSTYVITGGLGGIGMEVAKWMTSSGAKHVALIGRNPPNEKAQEEIRRMNANGAQVFTLQYDVGEYDKCKEMLETLENLEIPPVKGIMHAAGVLSDGTLVNQSWEKFEKTYKPKVKGGWNLHKLTLTYPLEHFVMFSSAVSSLGSLGQSNHASANYFMDTLANYRHYLGLPASTINWGQWGQVGVAANIEIVGLRQFSALQGISALERILKSQRLQTCVCEADFGLLRQVFSGNRRYLEELNISAPMAAKELVINKEQLWEDYENAMDMEGKLEVLRKFVRSMVRQILKLKGDETFSDDENFQDMGMDSLMMIEMKNVVQAALGKRANLTVNSVKDCHNVNQLAERLLQLLAGDEEVPTPTQEELCALMREDSTLPDYICHAPSGPCLPSEVKRVLITGVTGNMGPYFLRDLSKLPQIEQIYCLIRDDKKPAAERLQTKLEETNLLHETDMSKIVTIPGYITKPKLGLDDTLYNHLSTEVDAVFHLAVRSSFTEAYKKIDKENSSDMRTVNVKGTLEVLKYVCHLKQKLMFHASSIVANNAVDKDYSLSEDWPGEADFDKHPNAAYPISKYICDRLLGQGVLTHQLPVKVFRFPAVGGDSRSGANVNYDNNQLMLRMMGYLHLKKIPAVPIPFFILSVDECVRLSLNVFFQNDAPSDIYNVYNPNTCNETEVVSVAKELGYDVSIVEQNEFTQYVLQQEESILTHFLREVSKNDEGQYQLLAGGTAILTAWTRNPRHAFDSKKLKKFLTSGMRREESTLDVIRRDLRHAYDIGLFKKYGL